MKRIAIIFVAAVVALMLRVPLPGITIDISGESFVAGDHQVIVEYCYSRWTGRILYAVVQSWPKDATVAEKLHDPRVGRNFLGWTTIRWHDGRMLAAGTNGTLYFFEGDRLKTMHVHMTESDAAAAIGDSGSLEEVWACFLPFRIGAEDQADD